MVLPAARAGPGPRPGTGPRERESARINRNQYDLNPPPTNVTATVCATQIKKDTGEYRELASVESRNYRRYSGAGLSNRGRLISKSALMRLIRIFCNAYYMPRCLNNGEESPDATDTMTWKKTQWQDEHVVVHGLFPVARATLQRLIGVCMHNARVGT